MRRISLLLSVALMTALVAIPAPMGAAQTGPQVVVAPLPGVFQLPVAIAQHPESDDLYVVEKTGTIRALRGGLVYDPVPVLDVSSEVSSGLEQGLLGLAFSPDGDYIYVNLTDRAGDTRIIEFAFADGVADMESRREVLFLDQPQANHNGGTMVFGPDGYLYIGQGDGGGAGDPNGNAQNLDVLLGKLLRIDPRPSGDAAYRVPTDNPFVPQAGEEPVGRPEIWAYGLRNPWKFSFDKQTGDLWTADVGQAASEEIDFQPGASEGGENYGWNHMEGLELYDGRPSGAEEPADHVPPIYVYANEGSDACSVTGGYVYRGAAITSLQGVYIFSDWCDGKLRYLRQQNGEVTESGELGITIPSAASFAEDHDGELYGISLSGFIFKLMPAAS
jgi:glucose/arabinose dehydrogenase